jgi:hypothetical protein
LAAIRLADFRTITGLKTGTLSDPKAALLIRVATSFANRLSNRIWGHAIEDISTSGNGVVVKMYGHGLADAGRILLTGTGVAGLTDAVAYTRVDADSISVTPITLPNSYAVRGFACVHQIREFSVREQSITIDPGPVASVVELRMRSADVGDESPFGTASIVEPSLYFVSQDGMDSEIELSAKVTTQRYVRVRGYIQRQAARAKRSARVEYFAGSVSGVPEDVMLAIAGIAVALSKDQTGEFASENYDYYSYSRLSAAELAALPTSAVSTLLRYRRGM